MRKKEGQEVKSSAHIVVSEEVDKMQNDLHKALGGDGKAKVKLLRSRAQTRILILLKGNLEATEDRLQQIYKGVCKNN